MRGGITESTAGDPCRADSIELVVAMPLLEKGAAVSANWKKCGLELWNAEKVEDACFLKGTNSIWELIFFC